MLTLEYLKSIARYDKDTGLFKRVKSRGNKAKGTIIGSKDSNGYLIAEINGKKYKLHRLAWFYEYGEFPESNLDHINHDPSDNRISNLRLANHLINGANKPLYKNNKSGAHGVWFSKTEKKWKARIRVNYKPIHLGTFDNKKDAITAKNDAEIKYGFHKNHGDKK